MTPKKFLLWTTIQTGRNEYRTIRFKVLGHAIYREDDRPSQLWSDEADNSVIAIALHEGE